MRAYEASRQSCDVFPVKMVLRKEEISSWVGGTEEGAEDLTSMMGVGSAGTAVGILCIFIATRSGGLRTARMTMGSSLIARSVGSGAFRWEPLFFLVEQPLVRSERSKDYNTTNSDI